MARILPKSSIEKTIMGMGAMYVEESGILDEIYTEVDPAKSEKAVIENEVSEGFFRLDMGMGNEFTAEVLEILENIWDVSDAETAFAALKHLREQGHRNKFSALVKVANDFAKFKEVYLFDFNNETDAEIADEELKHLAEWVRKANVYIENVGILAWDLARHTHLVRLCFLGGILDAEQCWSELSKSEPLFKSKFKDWMQFAQSYLIGLSFWTGEEDEIMKSSCERLMGYDLSPWNVFPMVN